MVDIRTPSVLTKPFLAFEQAADDDTTANDDGDALEVPENDDSIFLPAV